jgi:hypothetical protein
MAVAVAEICALTRQPFRVVESLPRRPGGLSRWGRHDPLLWLLLGLTIAGDLASVASLLLLLVKP